MRMKWSLVFLSIALFAPNYYAQQPPAEKPQADKPQPEKTPLPKGLMPNLGRPTGKDDTLPPFNFEEYFKGTWTFEWLVPESVFGPAGKITGTTVYKPIDARFYEAATEATGPSGSFTIKEIIGYNKEQHALTRQVTDSRGFSYLQIGPVGGDLGGVYDIYLESAPFTVNGKSVRIKSTLRTISPLNYKVATSIATDGDAYTNFGNPWWRKQIAGATGR